MDWVSNFYEKQNRWANVYVGDVTDEHRKTVLSIERLAGLGKKKILELGAGGGQAAVAAAELGHEVFTIEISREFTAHARSLANRSLSGKLVILEGDFYEVELDDKFDVVCYWDGFGIGTDYDQRKLLKRVANWLKNNGCALIEVYTPWFGAYAAGNEGQFGCAHRRYGFDARGCRWTDRWWHIDDKSQATTQSLRCYSPQDLELLLEGTGLSLKEIQPGATFNFEKKECSETVPLEKAISYLAKITPN